MNTVHWQRLEGALVLCAALAGAVVLNGVSGFVPWWMLAVLFFAPDVGFAGYAAGPRVGAFVYNLLHLYGVAAVLLLIGLFVMANPFVTLLGTLWVGHIGFDRMLGYGLKEVSGFGDTHLGRIGRG